IMMFCWYHNSIGHILVALNRTITKYKCFNSRLQPGTENYSNEFVDKPLNSTSSLISMLAYAVTGKTARIARER
ncbi:hypothetical protein PMAYCL1PPCAC_16905, partial [Pristionchus mayeri]